MAMAMRCIANTREGRFSSWRSFSLSERQSAAASLSITAYGSLTETQQIRTLCRFYMSSKLLYELQAAEAFVDGGNMVDGGALALLALRGQLSEYERRVWKEYVITR
ncbi:Uncharacterized protein Fot_35293 [Forsythia ovata]|uniref:Uncharacterized protein n=1 Tax=Forsythia ovata TaxID=205694 RepID=A0ABD1SL43_9LAMI